MRLMALIESKRDIGRAIKLLIQVFEYQDKLEAIDKKLRYMRGDILSNAGDTLFKVNARREALEYYKLALPIYDECGDVAGRARVLANIGSILLEENQPKECINHYKEAEYLFAATGDVYPLSRVLLNLARACHKDGSTQEAKDYAVRAMKYFEILGDVEHSEIAKKLC